MWYEEFKKKEKKIDYNKPIFARQIFGGKNKGIVFMLLPQISTGYKHTGFNWFNLADGSYNSCAFWETPEKAVEAYQGQHNIYNSNILTTKN